MLEEEKSTSEGRCLSALSKENMTTVELKSYSDLKKELGAYGISINDDHIPKFAKVVYGISQKGYDVSTVIEEFSDLELMRTDYLSYQKSMPILKRKYDDLNQECSLKLDVVKAIRVLIAKLNPNNSQDNEDTELINDQQDEQ